MNKKEWMAGHSKAPFDLGTQGAEEGHLALPEGMFGCCNKCGYGWQFVGRGQGIAK